MKNRTEIIETLTAAMDLLPIWSQARSDLKETIEQLETEWDEDIAAEMMGEAEKNVNFGEEF